jgi:hypothetical protein
MIGNRDSETPPRLQQAPFLMQEVNVVREMSVSP